jgi:Bacteriophage Lambda NinG protein
MIEKGVNELKKQLDDLFSKFVRQRDSNEYGFVKCCTCEGFHHWKQMQCGHYHSRNILQVRFEETNTGPQCHTCNCLRDGEVQKFKLYLQQKYGPDVLQELDIKMRCQVKLSRVDYMEMIEDIQKKLKLLNK